MANREKLPGIYEKKYKSERLKENIADISMWALIPSVQGYMDSQAGEQRLAENDALFSFIDRYFPDSAYAFEPNMEDGRFVFVPYDVNHQGIGICASNNFDNALEIGHFWYPEEYLSKSTTPIGSGQLYIPMVTTVNFQELAGMVQRIYMNEEEAREHYCTFPFNINVVVTLRGYFMDRPNSTARVIRESLQYEEPVVRRNGEALAHFIQNY